MHTIRKGQLILIPRVTDMRNGMFRPEVVFSKGRASDIVFGELYDCRMRAELLADMAARSAIMNMTQLTGLWCEIQRAVEGCRRHVEALAAAV